MLYFTQTHKIIRRKILYKFHFVLTRRNAIKKLESVELSFLWLFSFIIESLTAATTRLAEDTRLRTVNLQTLPGSMEITVSS